LGSLKSILNSTSLQFLMEAHDGLSARIVADTGFAAVWASGLGMSTACGVRDRSELSAGENLRQIQYIVEAAGIPVLVDADSGYGDFNNARQFARRSERLGAAGVCLEDKKFPKSNSFRGEGQPLCDPQEFCGKIAATRDAVASADFCVVARTEALIAGHSLGEALSRAEMYRQSGADAVLVHSKAAGPSEVLAFAAEWNRRSPLLVVPTTYYLTPTSLFAEAGISAVIWANHNLRASLRAMRRVSEQIFRQQSIAGTEDRIASLAELFSLMDYEGLEQDEQRYASPSALVR
jgi:phosphoenolpyruvate phosphomutase